MAYRYGGLENVWCIREAIDGHLIVVGETKEYYVTAMKLNASNGSVMWSHRYSDSARCTGRSVTVNPNTGDIAIVGTHNFWGPGQIDALVLTLDNAGNPLWAWRYNIVGTTQLQGWSITNSLSPFPPDGFMIGADLMASLGTDACTMLIDNIGTPLSFQLTSFGTPGTIRSIAQSRSGNPAKGNGYISGGWLNNDRTLLRRINTAGQDACTNPVNVLQITPTGTWVPMVVTPVAHTLVTGGALPEIFPPLLPAVACPHTFMKSVQEPSDLSLLEPEAMIALHPNPIPQGQMATLNLQDAAHRLVDISVTNLLGQTVFQHRQQMGTTAVPLSIPTAQWSPGLYSLTVTYDQNTAHTQMLVVYR